MCTKEINLVSRRKLIYGVGINDADYVVVKRRSLGYVNGKQKTELLWACPFYKRWHSMLARCYSRKSNNYRPCYKDCTVCEEWLTFSNFKAWMEKQDWEGNHLDKDLLSKGNKVYSPENCIFISLTVNSFLVERDVCRGDWPIGVSWDISKGKFVSQCSNYKTGKLEKLGTFDCPQAAHQAWLERKMELATCLASIQSNPLVAEALLRRYQIYEDHV